MTFGEQNSAKEAFAQLDMACDYGVNFIDTAEMYPVPPKKETYSKTETIIGEWPGLKKQRNQLVLASKIAGPAEWMDYARPAPWNRGPELTPEHLEFALHNSLKRLNTDYLDLYQIHWPERSTNFFGNRGFKADPSLNSSEGLRKEYLHASNQMSDRYSQFLMTLGKYIKEGKIRTVGMSNETPWGMAKWLQWAMEDSQIPRPVSIQNPYSLLNRTFEIGLAEIALREEVGLLAYSPLAFGVLTGKYLNGQRPSKARLTLYSRFSRYTSENGSLAAAKYVQLAKDSGLTPATLALKFVQMQPFVTSTIIGATTLEQLQENLKSATTSPLHQGIIDELESIQRRWPDPCP